MTLRHVLDVLRRNAWLVVACVVVAVVAAIAYALLRAPSYEATATVLLRPNDPTERVDPSRGLLTGRDAERYVNAQGEIVTSPSVTAAAEELLRAEGVVGAPGEVSVRTASDSDLLRIDAVADDASVAAATANAYAAAYIEDRRQVAVRALETTVEEIDERLGDLEDRIAELTEQRSRAEAAGSVTQALDASLSAAVVQYETLFARQQDLVVEISLNRGGAEVVEPAEPPAAPIAPRPSRDIALAGILGVLLGAGLAFLREQLDDRIRSRDELEELVDLPVLGEVPTSESVRARSVSAISDPTGVVAEAIRAVRTSIQFREVERPLHTMVVTSPGPDEGKSVVAANVAAVYAQAGYSVVLVSSDLRRPSLERAFGLDERAPGLTDVLAAIVPGRERDGLRHDGTVDSSPPASVAAELDLALVQTGVPGLLVLPAGTTPPNPSELLASPAMRHVLEALRSRADLVVLDTPPVLAVTDAAVLAARADGVVFVCALRLTSRGGLRRALAALGAEPVRVLGVVVNRSEIGRRHGYYRYVSRPGPRAEPIESRGGTGAA